MENENQDGVQPVYTPTPGQPVDQTLELADGTDTGIAQTADTQTDAIDPYGQASITFESGNYKSILNYPQKMSEKITLINNTILPLVEKALIELLGSSNAYSRISFNGAVNINMDTVLISGDARYKSELFIGMDIDKNDIMHDANYVLQTIKVVPGVQWRKCAIDTSTGMIDIGFNC